MRLVQRRYSSWAAWSWCPEADDLRRGGCRGRRVRRRVRRPRRPPALRRVVDLELDAVVGLLGSDSERADPFQRVDRVLVDLEHRASIGKAFAAREARRGPPQEPSSEPPTPHPHRAPLWGRPATSRSAGRARPPVRELRGVQRSDAHPDRRGRDDHPARPARAARARRLRGLRARRATAWRRSSSRARASPDLAILDVKMPRLDGIEAARRILDERPIPIVMLTAYGQEELVARAVEAGVFGYLVKPFREQDLLPGDRDRAGAPRGARRGARGGGVARRGARRAQGDRAREGPADGEGGAHRGRRRSTACARRARSRAGRSR